MAQPKLEQILNNVAKNIADEKLATPFSDGRLISGARRLQAVNEARGTVFNAYVEKFQDPIAFADAYPDYLAESEETLSPLPDKVFFVMKLYHSGIIERVPKDLFYDAKYNTDSPYYSEAGAFRFAQINNAVTIINDDSNPATSNMLYVKRPVDVVQGGADIFESKLWIDDISAVATAIIFRGLQKQNSQQ